MQETPSPWKSGIPSDDHDWWREASVYQIYPRSFADSNGDGVGDLAGITQRVPYLQTLGVEAIWLSPFYPSELADGGYDVSDHRNVDPRLGTLGDFDDLVSAVHAASMRIIIDIVPNHTSDQHEWFTEALVSPPGSPARDRYHFRAGRGQSGELPPSDWENNFGGGCWTRVDDGQWYLHLFAPQQPDLNWDNPHVRDDFIRTLRFWSDRGVDGFRVDVAHSLAKDLSEPLRPSRREFDLPVDGSDPLYDRDEVHEIFTSWRHVLNEYSPPRAAVAEAWVPAARRVLYARPTELGQAFNFDLLRADFVADQFRSIIDDNLQQAAESEASSTWVLSNHDVVRHATRYGLPDGADLDAFLLSDGRNGELDRRRGLRRARAATLLLMALPGSAYIYQGEELGLFEVADLQPDELQDPTWERSGHQRKGRDGCRVPPPWTLDEPSFGFSSSQPHLRQPTWFARHAASVQDGVAGSTLEMYRSALRLRRALRGRESLEWVDNPSTQVLHLARSTHWHSITNFGPAEVPLPAGEVLLFSGPLTHGATLPRETTVWFCPSSSTSVDADTPHPQS